MSYSEGEPRRWERESESEMDGPAHPVRRDEGRRVLHSGDRGGAD